MNVNKATILIVDDIPSNIELLINVLREEYTVQVATSGKRAIEILKGKLKPDLILLDIIMPDMDGYQVLNIIQGDETIKNIPVIFVTANNDIQQERQGLSLGVVDYITKPFDSEVVKLRIKNQLELKSYHDLLEKKLLNELDEQNKQMTNYQSIFSNLNEGLLITDKNRKIIWANASFCDIMKYSFDELIGQRIGLIKSGFQTEEFYKELHDSIENHGFWKGIMWDKTKDEKNIQTIVSIFRTEMELGDFNYIGIYSNFLL
jgi:PAS domain S-box-containing protein